MAPNITVQRTPMPPASAFPGLAARQGLGTDETARLSEAVAGSLQVVYVVAGLVAVVSLLLALALPARLSPTRPAPPATESPRAGSR